MQTTQQTASSLPKMVNLKIYGHPNFADGLRCYFVVAEEAGKSVLINPASLERGLVDSKKVATGTPVAYKLRAVRENLINRVRFFKRSGRKLPKETMTLLVELGVAARAIKEVTQVQTDPRVVEQRSAAKDRAQQAAILDEALVEQNKSRMLVARVEAEKAAERKATGNPAKSDKWAAYYEWKLPKIEQLMRRPEGVTGAEANEACQLGYTSLSWECRHFEEKFGATVRVDRVKDGKTVRYFLRTV